MHTFKIPFLMYVFVAVMGCMTRPALAIEECDTNEDCAHLRCVDGGWDGPSSGQCYQYDVACVENACVRQNEQFFARRCAVSDDLPPDSEEGVEDWPFVVKYACNGGETGFCDTYGDGSPIPTLDTCTDTGDRSGGGSCTATNWECVGDGVLVSTDTSGTDSCVGFDTPGLTIYQCESRDGGDVADTCVEYYDVEEDWCDDFGSSDVGGSCDAVRWYCAGNQRLSISTSGTDTCGGTEDRPNVTYYSCEASDGSFEDSCIASVRGEPDECYDTGNNLGFGSCSATDWFCETRQGQPGRLRSHQTSGTDTCTDAFTKYYNCESTDGGPEGVTDSCVEQLQDCDDPFVGGLGDVCTNGVCDGNFIGCTTESRDAGENCRNGDLDVGSGLCDARDTCDGAGKCELNVKDPGTVCRTGSGDPECNPDEVCSGNIGDDCPVDVFSPSGTACGDGSIDNDCDAADTCDDSGICQDNVKPAGTLCREGSPDGICDPIEECTGNEGEDCPVDIIQPDTYVCNPGSGDECDPDELCTGVKSADCPLDVYKPATYVCNPSSTGWEQCDPSELCPGRPDLACPDDVIEPEGTACGSDSDTACTEPDSCDASGTCLPNNEACALVTSSSLCTFDVQPDKGMCTETSEACAFDAACEAVGGAICGNDFCLNADGESILDDQDAKIACTDPCLGGGDNFNGETDWCQQTGQFRLVFTPDVKSFPAYKLPASNPGQTYYNAVVQGEPNTTVTVGVDIPYPYVTVGGQPVHVYDAYDAVGICVNSSTGEVTGQACDFKAYPDSECGEGEYCDSSCFAPTVALQQFDIRWNIADYFEGAGMIDDGRVTCDDVCGPDGAGSCTFDVDVPIPASGQAYVNVHLDYGLKGVHEDANPCDDGLADRYDQGSSSGTGFADVGFDAWVNNDAGDGALGIGIADCTDYAFGHSVGPQTFDDAVQNLNVFKPIAGAFGRSGNSQSGLGHGGLKLTLAQSSNPGTILQTAITDQDGFYTLPYKHKGKPAWYTVSLYDEFGTGLLGSIGVELQGNGWTQIDFDSYATYEELCDIDKAFCECNGWCAVAEYGSGRQSGGGVGGGAVCELAQSGASCADNGDCCSNSCKGKQGNKTCK